MSRVEFVAMSGFRIRERELLALGMTLPGFADRGPAVAALPALGPLTMAGMLPSQWECGYHAAASVTEELIAEIIAARPTLVAVSALTASIQEAYSLATRLKIAGIATVVGGLHASVMPDEALEFFDAVVVGDGEAVWPDVLAHAEAGTLHGVYEADRRHRVHDWVMPRFDLIGSDAARYTIQTERGCPWACDFCGASRLLGSFREKPVEQIAKELDAVKQVAKRPRVELADDNTFAKRDDADQLLAVLKDSGVKWFTESDWRLGERPELLAKLADSGCVQVLVGMESMGVQYPGFGKKRAEFERMVAACEAIQTAGVAVNACFIVGADGETPASVDRLVDYLVDSPFAEVQLTLQTPFPGTGLYERLRKDGRLLRDRDWSYYTLFDVTYQPDRMSVVALENRFRRAITEVFGEEPTRRRREIRRAIARAGRSAEVAGR